MMPARVAAIVAATTGWLAQFAPHTMPTAFTDEMQAAVVDVCLAAYARGGWPALLTTGVSETLDVARCVAGARIGFEPRLTSARRIGAARPVSRRTFMLTTELRRAWRRLRARPSVALGAAAMLALGIGLTTSMFSLADSLLLRPVPFHDAANLAELELSNDRGGRLIVTPPVLRGWQDSGVFASVQAVSPGASLIDVNGGVTQRSSALVTPGVFDMLGVRPLRGRLFTPDEGRGGADDRVIISESVWRGLYGGDASLLGRAITVDGRSLTVVGVMPAAFHFPKWDTTVWMPIDYSERGPANVRAQAWPYTRFGSTPRADALAVATRIANAADASTAGLSAKDEPLAGLRVDPYYQRAIPLLGAGVVLVFVVLCANASSLILAGFTSRRREFGLCAALGASNGQLLREAIVETTCIGAAGSIVGLALAAEVIALARQFLPDAFLVRTLNPLDLNGRAVVAAVAAGAIAVLVAGVLPAWMATRGQTTTSLRDVERTGTSSRSARRMVRGLLAGEVALACMLLAGSTALVRSFVRLVNTDRGIEVSHVLTSWLSLPALRYPDTPARTAATKNLQDAIEMVPGVEQTAVSFGVPPNGGSFSFFSDWRSDAPGATPQSLEVNSFDVTPGFFDLYGIAILRGRSLLPTDGPDTAVISQQLAAKLWPTGDPVGHTFSFGTKRLRVVGISREVTLPSPDPTAERPEFYVPFSAGRTQPMISIRCRGACPDPALIRRRMLEAAPGATINRLEPAETAFVEQIAPPRAAASLSMIFAGVAFLAAVGGLFSVLTYAVGKRQREFGIRAALGASPPQIRAVVLRDGLSVAVAGVVIGAGLSWVLGRVLTSLEYGVSIADASTWAPPFLLIALASLAAVSRPARRAMRVDPALLLRGE